MPFVRGTPSFEPSVFKPNTLARSGGLAAAPARPGTATIYYVNPVDGNDSNNGLGPDASAGTNKPWKTIGKALGASGIGNGDTVYLSPGVYRETLTVAMTSPTVETFIIADPANAQGFKTAAGVLITPGQVQWTAYTTNDKTLPAGTLLNLSTRSYLTFRGIFFVGGTAVMIASTAGAVNNSFVGCSFLGAYRTNQIIMQVSGVAGNATGWLIADSRFLWGANQAIEVDLPTVTGPDYDANVVIRNCSFVTTNGNAIYVNGTGTLAGRGGGVRATNCFCLTNSVFMQHPNANSSSTVPSVVTNCFIYGGSGNVLNAITQGQIVEDYNLFATQNPRSNVLAGVHSISDGSYAPLIHFGQETMWGAQPRPFGEPMAGSPLLAFGIGNLSADLLGTPRPGGSASVLPAAGAYERPNNWGRETTTVRTGANALSIVGPGIQDFDIPVDATPTTLSVYLQYDTNYIGPRPALQVINGAECGVPDQIAPTSAPASTWGQTTVTFTPTQAGIVTARLLSADTSGTGKAIADDFAIA